MYIVHWPGKLLSKPKSHPQWSQLTFGNKVIAVNGTALVFTNPTIPYFWERISDQQKGYMCIFTASFFNRWGSVNEFPMFQSPDAGVVPLEGKEILTYTALFEKMFRELQGTYLYKYDLLRTHLTELIHEAQKAYLQHGYFNCSANAAARITNSFVELLERQFPIELRYQVIKLKSPAAFASHLNLHVNHLNKVLKDSTGQSTSQLINARIISEAQILLKRTDWTIAEIAASLGFEEPNNFSSFFKSRTAFTPKKFRLQLID